MSKATVVTRAGRGRRAHAGEADPITTEVIRHGLVSVAEQMKRALIRTAYSPIIYDVLDFATAVYDRDVRLLGQAPTLPIFMGTLGFSVEAAVSAVGSEDALEPGDILYINVPYLTGTHPQDAALVMPVFLDGELVGYSAVKAHLIDVGGKDPYATDTTDVFQEGTIFPGVKLYSRGEPVRDILRTLLANSRVPHAIAGDLNAQVVSLRTGAEGLARVVQRYGIGVFSDCVERMLDHGERLVREYFSRIPDGCYSAQGEMDNDGLSDDPIPFTVRVDVKGSDIRIDFSAAPDARPGPVNCPLPDTVGSTRVAIMMLAGGGDQPNEGHFRPIEIVTRPGSMFHPISPSPCFLVGWATLQAMEVIYRALAVAMPDGVPAASGGDILVVVPWGIRSDTGEAWADCTVNPIGQGAHARGDGGNSLMHISEAATRLASVEISEARNPWRFERLELAADSGGPGRHRGGLGVDTAIRFLDDSWLTTVVERTRNPPWGLHGGLAGRPNAAVVELPDGTRRDLTKQTRLEMPAGSLLELRSGGGGGFGHPAERAVEDVARDVAAGYVTAEAATATYPHAATSLGPH